MIWIIGAILAAIAFFIWQVFRMRCPMCGHIALHSKDRVAEAQQREYHAQMKKTGLLEVFEIAGIRSVPEKPGYANAKFRCKKCDWSFDRRTALFWCTTANRFGEQIAIHDYKKIQEEKRI